MTAGPGLLAQVRVAQLGAVGPGARAARILADYGAEVVRVEPPTGRRSGGGHDVPFHAYSAGRDTRRIRIDLADPSGRDVFVRLADRFDVVIASFRPGAADRMGVGDAALRTRNPAIIYCSISGYGTAGPYASWAGHDIDYLAVSGLAANGQRRADGGPAVPGATLADGAGGGMQAALAVMAALVHRARTGEGIHLDCAAVDGTLWLMSVALEEHLAMGTTTDLGATLLTGTYAWYDFYRAADDRWLAVGAIEPRFYRNLCGELGLDHLADRQHDRDQRSIRDEFAAVFSTRSRDDWVARLGPADTCVAPVNTVAEAFDDPHVASRLPVVVAHHPDHGTFRQLGPLLAGAMPPPREIELPPSDHTDTEQLLTAAGVPSAEIAALRRDGAIE
ncbi:MAG: CoA transferase [Acidimicrobiales bacterium]|nr:CoA transferase [Acidimicrobiales bacterium]